MWGGEGGKGGDEKRLSVSSYYCIPSHSPYHCRLPGVRGVAIRAFQALVAANRPPSPRLQALHTAAHRGGRRGGRGWGWGRQYAPAALPAAAPAAADVCIFRLLLRLFSPAVA